MTAPELFVCLLGVLNNETSVPLSRVLLITISPADQRMTHWQQDLFESPSVLRFKGPARTHAGSSASAAPEDEAHFSLALQQRQQQNPVRSSSRHAGYISVHIYPQNRQLIHVSSTNSGKSRDRRESRIAQAISRVIGPGTPLDWSYHILCL